VNLEELLSGISGNEPASAKEIEAVQTEMNIRFPNEYVRFLSYMNGGEGALGRNNYISLWSTHQLRDLNKSYEVPIFLPGVVLFGTDGGGEAYGFDWQSGKCAIVMVPFIGMSEATKTKISDNFIDFLIDLCGS